MTQFIKFLRMDLKSGDSQRSYFGKEAAGAIVYAKKEKAFLVLQRQKDTIDGWKKVKEAGTWSIVVSGKVDDGDKWPKITAKREFKEELHYKGNFKISEKPFDIYEDGSFVFTTFLITVDEIFEPKLNWEHSDFKWIKNFNDIPTPIHFGTKRLLKKLSIKFRL